MTSCRSCRLAWILAGLATVIAAAAVVGLLRTLEGERDGYRRGWG